MSENGLINVGIRYQDHLKTLIVALFIYNATMCVYSKACLCGVMNLLLFYIHNLFNLQWLSDSGTLACKLLENLGV